MPNFVDGLMVFKPREAAPEFIKAALVINRDALIKWLQEQPDEQITIDIKESKQGKYYAAVNEWQKKQDTPKEDIPTIPFN